MPPYRRKMRAKGFENRRVWGRRRRDVREDVREVRRGERPEAFSIIALCGRRGS